MGQYIPDITERFPEGFGGVDMTDRYFPSRRSPYDWGDFIDEVDDIPIPYEIDEAKETKCVFEIGDEYDWVDWFTGGVSYYTVKDINGNKLTFSEYRREIDGEYEKEETFEIQTDDDGNQYIKMCEYYGEVGKLYANAKEIE